MNLKQWVNRMLGVHPATEASPIQTEDISRKLDPWLLSCAVGAMNGSMYGSIGSKGLCDFDMWLRLVRRDDWVATTGVSEKRVADVLRAYAERNKHRHMNDVLAEEEEKRGLGKSFVLGPGKSATLSISIDLAKKP